MKRTHSALSMVGGSDIAFAECKSCGSSVAQVYDRSKLYDNRDSTNYSEQSAPFIISLKKQFIKLGYKKLLAEIDKDATIVDFGCGGGELCNSLYEIGYRNVLAADIQKVRPKTLHSRIRYSSIEEIGDCNPKYVFARHVWEHLDNPLVALQNLATIISPDCCVVIEVPNSGSAFRKLLARRWPGYFAPYHTIIYSEVGLKTLVERSGFRVTAAKKPESPLFGIYFVELGLPTNVARFISASIYPLQWIISKLLGTSEAVLVVAKKKCD